VTARGWRLLAAGLAAVSPRLRRSHEGRLRSLAEFAAWARSASRAAPLVLFHASSAGEARQVEPVLRRFRRAHPACQLAFTWFSSSGEPAARELPVEVAGYLPYDVPRDVGLLLDALRPALLVVGKLDVWPELVLGARARGIRLALIAATVRPRSSRLWWPARLLTHRAYAAFDLVAAVSEEDADRLVRLGVNAPALIVAGDPRADSVLERVAKPAPETFASLRGGPPALVAGSTWPADDRLLLRAFSQVRRTHPESRLLLVPHAPDRRTEIRLRRTAARYGLPEPTRLAAATAHSPLVFDETIGRLAWLYRVGELAYVGGGLGWGGFSAPHRGWGHGAGLHSVLEPAAWGIPVLTGPGWQESGDAVRLYRTGALLPLGGGEMGTATELAELWNSLLDRPADRIRRGSAGRRVVEEMGGASDRLAGLLGRYLVPPTTTPS
jgi:3-deoxy-D-manno-octulosonic-acid transferase